MFKPLPEFFQRISSAIILTVGTWMIMDGHITSGIFLAFQATVTAFYAPVNRLISALYDPWEGKITFDGKERSEIPRPVFTASVSMIDQDTTVFADTIENNIKMWDTTISDSDMFQAARDAELHDSILHRRDGYRGILEENGQNLSGEQCQRLEIARGLAGNPTILIMDEATSALDNVTQKTVSDYLDQLQCTRVVIAHRLSTIQNCDRIMVMDQGKIIECGTYYDLIAENGLFAELVSRQQL